jgi:prolyl oligopeptidase
MHLKNYKTVVLLSVIAVSVPVRRRAIAQASLELPDNYQWLGDVSGNRSMAWVNAQNERTAKVLEADSRYADLKVLESPDRLAAGQIGSPAGAVAFSATDFALRMRSSPSILAA